MGKSKDGRLTPRQEKYCERRAAGDSRAAAYKAAGFCPAGNRETARNNAEKMERSPGVGTAILHRIDELRESAERGAVLDRDARAALLSELALDTGARDADRVRAVDILCRMSGDYTGVADIRVTVAAESERREAWREILGGTGSE